jgi:ketosteroid isomerase-like protein
MPALSDPGGFARDWIESWNTHDLARIMSHYADDVEFTSPFAVKLAGDETGVVRGKAELEKYFSRALETFPELHFELFHVLTSVRSITLFYRSVNDLLAAEAMQFDDNGKIARALAHYCPAPP